MSLGTKKQRMEGMKRQAQELIEQAYQRGYNEGYSKAENDYYAKTEDDRQSSYELGLNMAWDAAEKIAGDCLSESRMTKELFNFNYAYAVFKNFSVSEAIEKIHAYEEQKKQEEDTEIHVGDEVVTVAGDKGVVIGISNNDVFLFICGCNMTQIRHKLCCKKTGRTFQEFVEVLKKMKEGE